jgi:hypothetical protein
MWGEYTTTENQSFKKDLAAWFDSHRTSLIQEWRDQYHSTPSIKAIEVGSEEESSSTSVNFVNILRGA